MIYGGQSDHIIWLYFTSAQLSMCGVYRLILIIMTIYGVV